MPLRVVPIVFSAALVAQAIDLAVIRQRQVGARGNDEIVVRARNPCARKARISSTSTTGSTTMRLAEHAGDARAQHARRDQARDVLLAVDDQRVAGVRAARPANHVPYTLGQHVDDLAFPLVPPLRPDDDYDGHVVFPLPFLMKFEFQRAGHGVDVDGETDRRARAAIARQQAVVAAALQHRAGGARDERLKAHARVVVEAAHLAEIDVQARVQLAAANGGDDRAPARPARA